MVGPTLLIVGRDYYYSNSINPCLIDFGQEIELFSAWIQFKNKISDKTIYVSVGNIKPSHVQAPGVLEWSSAMKI